MSTEKPGEDGSLDPKIIASSDAGADNTISDLKIRPDYEPAQDMPIGFDNLEAVRISWAFDAIDRISDEHVPSWQTEADYDTKEEKDRRAKRKQFLSGLEAAGVHGVIVDQTGHVQAGTSKWARRIEASSTLRLKDGKLTALAARSVTDLQAGLGVLYDGYQGKHLSVPLRTLDGWVVDMVRLFKCEATLGPYVAVLLPKTAQDEMATITGLQVFAGLTKSEANIATLLSQACMVEEIAAIRKTSVATVKSQIKGLLAKLGLRRQADLVRLVSTAR
jgi:DNA-binding CsgD family transcriptional regulator